MMCLISVWGGEDGSQQFHIIKGRNTGVNCAICRLYKYTVICCTLVLHCFRSLCTGMHLHNCLHLIRCLRALQSKWKQRAGVAGSNWCAASKSVWKTTFGHEAAQPPMAVLTVAVANSCRSGALLPRRLRLSPTLGPTLERVDVCVWLSSENYAEARPESVFDRTNVCRLRSSSVDPGGLISWTQLCIQNEGIIAKGRTARLVCG